MKRHSSIRRTVSAAAFACLLLTNAGCFKCLQCFHKPCQKMDKCAVDAMPRELDKATHPEYVVEPPDIVFIETLGLPANRPLYGEKIVRPDGTINLGYYGDAHVAGLTLAEIEAKIEARLKQFVKNPRVHLDMAGFNSKVFYVVGQVGAPGRIPITGNETVLDALMLSGGLTPFANKCDIRLVRPRPMCSCDQVLPVDWNGIINCGDTTTNYQLMPGDRLVVPATVGYETMVFLENFLAPVNQVLFSVNIYRLAFGNNNNN